jgi:hypothetical protein
MRPHDQIHVDITNVARWLLWEQPKEYYDLTTDFDQLMSPWNNSVYEWNMPRKINSEGRVIDLPIAMRYRVLCGAGDLRETNRKYAKATFKKITGEFMEEIDSPDVAYITNYHVETMRPIASPLGQVTLFLDETGALTGRPRIHTPVVTEITDQLTTILYPIFYAYAFMACKNVELVDRPMSRQRKRKAERKNEPIYKVLVIDANRTQRRYEEINISINASPRALHICRGHFATYTEERPLFGKYAGTFWVPMHVKGSRAAGEVVKDYKVTP